MKISASIVYVIFQQFFGGREIAQEGGEILPKVSTKFLAKFWENFVSSNFTKTATLSVALTRVTVLIVCHLYFWIHVSMCIWCVSMCIFKYIFQCVFSNTRVNNNLLLLLLFSRRTLTLRCSRCTRSTGSSSTAARRRTCSTPCADKLRSRSGNRYVDT